MKKILSKKLFSRLGFSIIEIMIVIVMIGLLAAIAIPGYNKSIKKSHEQDMRAQLMAIHSALQIYKSKNGAYWNAGGGQITSINTLNTNLKTNIILQPSTTISYKSVDGSGFTCAMFWNGHKCTVTENTPGTTNPGCDAL